MDGGRPRAWASASGAWPTPISGTWCGGRRRGGSATICCKACRASAKSCLSPCSPICERSHLAGAASFSSPGRSTTTPRANTRGGFRGQCLGQRRSRAQAWDSHALRDRCDGPIRALPRAAERHRDPPLSRRSSRDSGRPLTSTRNDDSRGGRMRPAMVVAPPLS